MSEEGSASFEAWLDGFARGLSSEAEVQAFVDKVDDAITGQIPEIAADPVLTEDLHSSTRHQWLSFVSMLPQPQHRLVLPVQAADLARSVARRGQDLGVLLKIYRAAHSGVFGYIAQVVDSLDEKAPPRDQVLKFFWSRADQWIDDSIEALIETFYEERQEQHEGVMARRAELIETILEGGKVSVDQASETLGHALLQWQSAFVLWADQAGVDTTDRLLATANDLSQALEGSRPLIRVAGSRDLWCWVATPTKPDPAALTKVAASLPDRGIRVAAGVPTPGLSGFRTCHEEARAAQHLCVSAVRVPTFVEYSDVELLCLAADNADLLRRMVTREIGELCGADKNLAMVRETALTFLTNRMNVEATADKLFVHKNTVRYRLNRAEELLGHPLTERAAHVELALRYVSLFGPPNG